MSKRLIYPGRFKGPLLMEQILAAHPEWIDSEAGCLLGVETTDTEARITVPDNADEVAITALIEAHNPDALSLIEQAGAMAREFEEKAIEARVFWDSYEALKDKTPTEIVTIMQKRMDAWVTLADARKDLREWLPRMAALLAWGVRHG